MQNFDFTSLYNNQPQTHNRPAYPPYPHMMSGNMDAFAPYSEQNQAKKPAKKKNRLITVFLFSILIAFSSGLIAGIRLAKSPSTSDKQIDTTVSSEVKEKNKLIHEKLDAQDSQKNTNEKKDGVVSGAASKGHYYVKIFPSLKPREARKVAKSLLDKKYPVHYSKLENGNYFLYTGPYDSRKEAGKWKRKIAKLKEVERNRAMTRLVKK